MIRGPQPGEGHALLAALVVLVSGLAQPSQSAAQESEEGVRGAIHVSVGTTTVKGQVTGFWGIGGHLLLGDYRLGGGGYTSGGADFVSDGGSNANIDLGYGGVELDAPLHWVSSEDVRWFLLVGGGRGAVIETVSGRELGADNFVVLEPRISVSRPLADAAQGSIAVGYRAAFGVNDLPGVGSLALSGPTVSISISAPALNRR